MASVAYAGPGPQGQSVGMQESLAAESGVQHPRNAAESTDAETAHGARKRVSHLGIIGFVLHSPNCSIIMIVLST